MIVYIKAASLAFAPGIGGIIWAVFSARNDEKMTDPVL